MVATTSADLRFLCVALVVPVLLVVVLSAAFGVLGTIFLQPGREVAVNHGLVTSGTVSFAIIVTAFVCVPLFIVAALCHFRDR